MLEAASVSYKVFSVAKQNYHDFTDRLKDTSMQFPSIFAGFTYKLDQNSKFQSQSIRLKIINPNHFKHKYSS